MDIITSRHNPIVKEVRELKKRAARDTLGLAFVEGVRLVGEALTSRASIRSILMSESFSRGDRCGDIVKQAAAMRIGIFTLSDRVFGTLSDTLNPQGLLAVIDMFNYVLADVSARDATPGRLLILDHITDPGNAGVMLRTAEAAAFSGVILSEGSVDIYEPKTLRATMGAVFRIPFIRGADLTQTLNTLKRDGFFIYAAAAPPADGVLSGGNNPTDCFRGELNGGDIAIIVGSEAFGVCRELIEMCDGVLTIPMRGGAESLNAGIAAGILMYEFVRRDIAGARA